MKVEFFFDFISPYSWLARHRCRELSIELESRPILFAALLNQYGHLGPAEIPPKREYTMRDVARWAKFFGLKYEGPPMHPFNPLLCLRSCVAVEALDVSKRETFVDLLLDQIWSEGVDPTSPETINRVVTELKLDPAKIGELVGSTEIKDKVKKNTELAIEYGLFGVPTFRTQSGELFWGHDRIELLKASGEGKIVVDEEHLVRVLARPQTTQRKR